MDRMPTHNELLYLVETKQIDKLISEVKKLPSDIRNNLDTDLKNKIGRALKEYYANVEMSSKENSNEQATEPLHDEINKEEHINTPEIPTYNEEQMLSELTSLCNNLGIAINFSSTSKGGTISPFIAFDLSRSFNPYYDNILVSLHEEKFIDMRFSRKYQNEFDFIVKYNNRGANAGKLFSKLIEIINNTDIKKDYDKDMPGDLYNLKRIYSDDEVNSDIHGLIYTKLEESKYAYLLNSDLDLYIDYALNIGFTECASGTNIYRTAQLISYDKDDAISKLDYIASNISYSNSMYNSMMSSHSNEVIKEYSDVPFEQILNMYKTYHIMDNGNSVTSVVVATPLDNQNKRVVKLFRPTSPTETRVYFNYSDPDTFDEDILPKIVSTFAGNGRTKTSINNLPGAPRAFYQAMSDYGDTLSLANMSTKTIASTKQSLTEINKVYHHVQRDMIEYEKMNTINGYLASILMPFLMAFTGIVAIAMIIKLILKS